MYTTIGDGGNIEGLVSGCGAAGGARVSSRVLLPGWRRGSMPGNTSSAWIVERIVAAGDDAVTIAASLIVAAGVSLH